MITRKLWNSFSVATRMQILETLGYHQTTIYSSLVQPYRHDFNYDCIGNELLKILNRLYKESSGSIKIVSWVNPTYEEEKAVKKTKNSKDLIIRYGYLIADYEHAGDFQAAVLEITRKCPKATNFNMFEEVDYEAENEYKMEYGELDEHIYKGYVKFDAPMSCRDLLEDIDCYPV